MVRRWVRLSCGVAVVLLACGGALAGTIVFSDDFESGNLDSWTQGASPFNISFEQNAVPLGGVYSAQIDNSADRMYRNLGTEVSGQILYTMYLYDDTQARAFMQMTAYTGAGYGDGTLQQLLAIGKYNTVTMAGEVYDGTKYQGRLLYPSASFGWFNLNGPGAPSRSPGWHRFDIEVMPGGTDVNYYVDSVLCRSFTGALAATYDSIAIGLGAGTTAGNAWVDGVQFEVTAVAVPGDANSDGKVDDLDASILAANWQRMGDGTWATADFNGDTNVNDLDASILAANWQYGVGAAVPEPATWALLVGLALVLRVVRRT